MSCLSNMTRDQKEQYVIELYQQGKTISDWNYTLRHWIDSHACNIICEFTDIASPFPNDKTIATSGAGTSNLATTTAMDRVYDSSIFKEIQDNKQVMKCKSYSRQKETFKCNYCKLMFTTRIKRKQHVQEWHTATNKCRSNLRKSEYKEF
jgi:hypothetical protein